MKKLVIFLFILCLLPSILALSLEIEKTSSDEVMVTDIDRPVVWDIKITNYGNPSEIEFYNLLGFSMTPTNKISINKGETKEIQLKISPIGEFNYQGAYTFTYFIKDQNDEEISEKLTFKIVDLKNSFEIGANDVDPESNSIQVYIHNKFNFDYGKITSKFSSSFFNFEESFELGPYEKKNFDVQLNKEDYNKLMAGFYTMNAEVSTKEKTAEIEGTINFIEKNIVTSTEKDNGIIISTKKIKKTNEGNVISESETILKKNIISRLFTSFSPEPDDVERKGLTIFYSWNRLIKPGETLEIIVKTNWLFPFLIIFLIVLITVLVKKYTGRNIVVRKKVSFVKAKGGEFALKVTLFVHSKQYIENVRVIDRLPPLTKIYERFGGETPQRIDEKARKLEWEFMKLESGEIRRISYIIYSKIGILGKFALPSANILYEKEGKIHETSSNRAFFVAEARTKDIGDE